MALLLLNQCGGTGSEPASPRPQLPHKPVAAVVLNAGLPALVVAQVPPGTQGPVIAHFDDRSVAVFVRTTDSSWQFQSVVIHPSNGRVDAPFDLGPAPGNIGLLFVKPLATGDSLLAYTHLDDDGAHHLSVQVLDTAGKRRVDPIEIAASSETLPWIDVVPNAQGPLIFWATRRGDRADVRAAALAPDGSLRLSARDVLSDLRAWQVTPSAQGAALASVRATENKINGTVSVTFLDDAGVVVGKPIAVTQSDTAELDVDIVNIGKNAVVAWTDRLNGDTRLHAAAVNDRDGIVTAAYPLTPPLGDQLLIRLVPPHAHGAGYILWENAQVPTREHRLQLAVIDEKAQLGKQRVSLAYPGLGDHAPEATSTANGLALLTQIPASVLGRSATPQSLGLSPEEDQSLQVPVFAALSDKLVVTGIEPLLTASRPKVPSVAWGLECRNTKCFALGALSTGTDVAVLGIPLSLSDRAGRCLMTGANDVGARVAASADAFDANLRKWMVEDTTAIKRPRLAAVRVLGNSPPLADLAVARSGDVPWVSTLTYADADNTNLQADSSSQNERASAQIELRGPLGETSVVGNGSRLRALSAGGLAWANSLEDKDKILVYSALDQKVPQLYAARFDRAGKKVAQRKITIAPGTGNLSSITATGVVGGYFIGWIDERGTNTTAHFARLTHALDRKAPQQTISSLAGTKTGLQLLTHGNEVWAIWSDARESSTKRADIFLLRLAQSDGHPLAPEQRLFDTPAHSHTPQMSAYQSGVVAAFMEVEPRESQPAAIASVRVARLDDAGRPSVMRPVQVSEGEPTGFGIDCAGDTCHIAIAVDLQGIGQLEVASFDPQSAAPIRTTPLIRSQGPADESVLPVIVGNDVYWVDRNTEKRVRVMRAAIEW